MPTISQWMVRDTLKISAAGMGSPYEESLTKVAKPPSIKMPKVPKMALEQEAEVQAVGNREGALKGWDTRGRGRAKKNFEPPSSVVKKPTAFEEVKRVANNASGYHLSTVSPSGTRGGLTYKHPDGHSLVMYKDGGWAHRAAGDKTYTKGQGAESLQNHLEFVHSGPQRDSDTPISRANKEQSDRMIRNFLRAPFSGLSGR